MNSLTERQTKTKMNDYCQEINQFLYLTKRFDLIQSIGYKSSKSYVYIYKYKISIIKNKALRKYKNINKIN